LLTAFLYFGVRQPRPEGVKREREDWELIWHIGMGGSLLLAFGIYYFRPDTRFVISLCAMRLSPALDSALWFPF
jgi:hypothetical protein